MHFGKDVYLCSVPVSPGYTNDINAATDMMVVSVWHYGTRSDGYTEWVSSDCGVRNPIRSQVGQDISDCFEKAKGSRRIMRQ